MSAISESISPTGDLPSLASIASHAAWSYRKLFTLIESATRGSFRQSARAIGDEQDEV